MNEQNEPIRRVKQIIVVRTDLEMKPGKLASQVAHASMAFLSNKIRKAMAGDSKSVHLEFSEAEMIWLRDRFTKIILTVPARRSYGLFTGNLKNGTSRRHSLSMTAPPFSMASRRQPAWVSVPLMPTKLTPSPDISNFTSEGI